MSWNSNVFNYSGEKYFDDLFVDICICTRDWDLEYMCLPFS